MNLEDTTRIKKIRRTKIIATLGPATDKRENLFALMKAGADVLRLNMSHGPEELHIQRAGMVR